tara:strand:- start:44638 stop:45666 length:1029 start_codon:yes stop_codon:yes gene_type:complete
MGAVLRSTSLLPAIRRKYAKAHITWVTKPHCKPLLSNVSMIDEVITTNREDLDSINGIDFDVALVIDKSREAIGIAHSLNPGQWFGFKMNPINGGIIPATEAATRLWELGLNNNKKFFENRDSENRLVHTALELGSYQNDEYIVDFSGPEKAVIESRRDQWGAPHRPIVGINTGCADVIRYKRMPVELQRKLIIELLKYTDARIVLLGGPGDKTRNEQIAYGLDVVSSPVTAGTRDGMCSVAACDIVFSGDSLGMHMAIGMKKWVVPWFGPTCAHEIELFGRGRKVLSMASCSPCWKRECNKAVMCYDQVIIEDAIEGIKEGIKWTQNKYSSSKPPLLEMPY